MNPERKLGSSRRDFLKNVGIGLAGVVSGGVIIEQGQENKKEVREQRKTIGSEILSRSHFKKIDFSTTERELSLETKKLILMIVEHENEISSSSISSGEVQESKYDHSRTEKSREVFWQRVQVLVPNLPAYSLEEYYNFFLFTLPELLAKEGIYAEANLATYLNPIDKTIQDEVVMSNFFTVNKTGKDQIINDEGVLIERTIVHLGGRLTIDGIEVLAKFKRPNSGKTQYLTIFLNDENIAAESKNAGKLIEDEKMSRPEIFLISDANFWDLLEEKHDKPGYAIQLGYLRVLRKVASYGLQPQTAERIIAHETGHLVVHAQPNGIHNLHRKATTDMGEFFREFQNFNAHDEIGGFIGELRYAPKGQEGFSLLNLCALWLEEVNASDYAHRRAMQWIKENIVEIVSKDPSRFGIRFRENTAVSRENQVLFFLSDILDTPGAVDNLTKELSQVHKKKYSEPLGNEFRQFEGVSNKKPEELLEVLPNSCQFIGGTIALASVAWLLLKIRGSHTPESEKKSLDNKKSLRKSGQKKS